MNRVPTFRLRRVLLQLLSLAWLCRSFNNPLGLTPWSTRSSVCLSQFRMGDDPNSPYSTRREFHFNNGSNWGMEERDPYTSEVNGKNNLNKDNKNAQDAGRSLFDNSIHIGPRQSNYNDDAYNSRGYGSFPRDNGYNQGSYTPYYDSSNRRYGNNYDAYGPRQDSLNNGPSVRGYSNNYVSPNRGYDTNIGSPYRGYDTNVGAYGPRQDSMNNGPSVRGYSNNYVSPNRGYDTNIGSSNRAYRSGNGPNNGPNNGPSVRGHSNNYDSSNRGYGANTASSTVAGSSSYGYRTANGYSSSNRSDSNNRDYGTNYGSSNRGNRSTNRDNGSFGAMGRNVQNEWNPNMNMFDIEQQLIGLTEILLDSNLANDWNTYASLCDPYLTTREPGAQGRVVEGLEFHKRLFDLNRDERNRGRQQTTMRDPEVKLLGERAASVSYSKLAPGNNRDFRSAGSTVRETRVWEVIDGRWLNVHFQQNAPTR